MNTQLMPQFSGVFSRIPTYDPGIGAYPTKPEGGIHSDTLSKLASEARKKFPGVRIEVNPYDNPARIRVNSYDASKEKEADQFVKNALQKNEVRFDYVSKKA